SVHLAFDAGRIDSLTQLHPLLIFFSFTDTATPEIYTLTLHDALPIFHRVDWGGTETHRAIHNVYGMRNARATYEGLHAVDIVNGDRKSTRLNSSHVAISYAVFCLKKKNYVSPLHSL